MSFFRTISDGGRVIFDSGTRRVQAEDSAFQGSCGCFHTNGTATGDAAARLLAAEIVAGRLRLPKWDHSVTQWILRLNLLANLCPDLQLPAIRDEDRHHIIEQICLGAVSYNDIKDRDVKPLVSHGFLRVNTSCSINTLRSA